MRYIAYAAVYFIASSCSCGEYNLGNSFKLIDWGPKMVVYSTDSLNFDIPPNITSVINMDKYMFLTTSDPRNLELIDPIWNFPYGRDGRYYWFIEKSYPRVVGPMSYYEAKVLLEGLKSGDFQFNHDSAINNTFSSKRLDFIYQQHGVADYYFYKIDNLYVVETCVQNLEHHFIQFSKDKDIFNNYTSYLEYDILNHYYSSEVKPYYESLYLPPETHIYEDNYVNNIGIDTLNNKVYFYGLWDYSAEFEMHNINLSSNRDLLEKLNNKGMVVFSFPGKDGHVSADSSLVSFTWIAHKTVKLQNEKICTIDFDLDFATNASTVYNLGINSDIVRERKNDSWRIQRLRELYNERRNQKTSI